MTEVAVWWIRRDLRIEDNCALFHALVSGRPVLPVFVFDHEIIEGLPQDDRRVHFIYQTLCELKNRLESMGSSLLVLNGSPARLFSEVFRNYRVTAVYASVDYEPYSLGRDSAISSLCLEQAVDFHLFHDHIAFHPAAVLKNDGSPYHVFTPYSRAWLSHLGGKPLEEFPSEQLLKGLLKMKPADMQLPGLLNANRPHSDFPEAAFNEDLIAHYHLTRDFPAVNGTSRLGIHLRFGTISIRRLINFAAGMSTVFLNELIWREFYQMILYHHPGVVTRSFKPGYDRLKWLNREEDIAAWCEGRTGYPLVDAGMRQLVNTGFMHNRVRMVTASFLTKHLLVDWRLGEAFFARHLLDYELASNNGGWQWAAGSGCDAAPYFRVFNPTLQQQRFDPEGIYVKRWVPENATPGKYVKPVIDHAFARERAINFLRQAHEH
jgi:deoxyribodipyrimidine photo-lyase